MINKLTHKTLATEVADVLSLLIAAYDASGLGADVYMDGFFGTARQNLVEVNEA
ncbi:MAG: hypothetical protein ACK5JD_06925 [Mangrovibacterium sp.]